MEDDPDDLVIPYDINDIAVMGGAKIEHHGVNSRVYFFTERPRRGEPPGKREVVLSVWIPTAALASLAELILRATNDSKSDAIADATALN